MHIGTTNLFNGAAAYGNKAELSDNMAVRLVNNQIRNKAEQEDLGLEQDVRTMQKMMSIQDGPLKKLGTQSLIDRGLSVVNGVYDAFQKSVNASREQYIDPLLDQMAEYEKQLQEAKSSPNADPSDMERLQQEIDFLQKNIQDTTNWFIEKYSEFYGGFLKGTLDLYNRATDGQFEKVLAHYLKTPDGQSGLMDFSAKALGLDNLEGDSADIRNKFAEANKRLDQFKESLEKAQRDFRKATGLADNHTSETLKLLMHSEQLDLLDRLLEQPNSGVSPDTRLLDDLNGIREVNVEYRFHSFDTIV